MANSSWISESSPWPTTSSVRRTSPGRSPNFPSALPSANPAGSCKSLTSSRRPSFSPIPYFSSFSDALLRHAREAAERYIREFSLNSQSHVVEIASNDGYLLQNFTKAKIPCLGIEPAANIAKVAREKGIETLVEFFGDDLAKKLAASGKKADLILGNNVFAHAPSTNDFVSGLKTLLQPKGRIVLEFPMRSICSSTPSLTPFTTSMSFISR